MSAASIDALGTNRVLGSAAYRAEDFPGCESFHLPAGEIDRYDGRLEFWDSVTETAWKVCEPTSIQREGPSRRLVQMATRFEIVRGSRIVCFGSADLVRLDAAGRKRWLMQADEVLYLHPDRVRLQGPAIDVDEDPLPEVVLEVDHTTDVRRRKLDIYKESGFPEIWVLVPWESGARAGAGYPRPGGCVSGRGGEQGVYGVEGGGDSALTEDRAHWSGRHWRWVRAKVPGRRTTRSRVRSARRRRSRATQGVARKAMTRAATRAGGRCWRRTCSRC